MAVKDSTGVSIPSRDGSPCVVTKWVLAVGDSGKPVTLPALGDRSVHIYGTVGAGGSITMQGSNDVEATGQDWQTLDGQSAPLTLLTGGIYAIMPTAVQIRPLVVGGDGTTNITVILLSI